MKNMFKFWRILCLVVFLLTVSFVNVIYAGVGNVKIQLHDFFDNPFYTSIYTGEIAEDQNKALEEFTKYYSENIKGKLKIDEKYSFMLRKNFLDEKAPAIEYRNFILEQAQNPEVRGSGSEFSILLSDILTKFGLENHILYVKEEDPFSANKIEHVANLIKYNGQYVAADALMDIYFSESKSVNFLNMSLEDYRDYLRILGFINPQICVESVAPEDIVGTFHVLPFSNFITLNEHPQY